MVMNPMVQSVKKKDQQKQIREGLVPPFYHTTQPNVGKYRIVPWILKVTIPTSPRFFHPNFGEYDP